MNSALSLLAPFAVGLVVGLAFFGGLWLTVRRLDRMKNPGPVIFLSSILRIALAMAAILWVSRDGLPAIGSCLAGFLLARFFLIKKVRKSGSV